MIISQPNEPAPPNAGIASRLAMERPRPGVGEPGRSAIRKYPMKFTIPCLIVAVITFGCSPEPVATSSSVPPQFTITPDDVASVSMATTTPDQERTFVEVEFSSEGGEAFRRFTQKNVNRQAQILIGTQVVAEPMIQSEIPGGKIQVRVSSASEAQSLIDSLNRR